ncbi:hypothetical protein NQ315_002123 [Exocentrus adspersus]|uniref:Uncharacterized protein n=1 Tax=Exocentrus adspersus TaxID=1586481 RepID=A0AAV8VYN8_9CUCU|nr:hypothetical protein NQ315_002123 [Exocentrus adspersus]
MLIKLLVCVFSFLCLAEGKPREIKCPDYCKCDVMQGLRRATCQNKKLYSIEIDIPPQAEVLDLSYNQISELGSHIFLEIGLTNLKLLNLSHNRVSQVHLHGFEGLTNLKTLDLSYNMLRYFLEQWFVSLNSLQELYLKGNNLKSINDEPRLSLKQLRVLDISNCAIHGLRPGVFQNLPKLELLDVSENYLISLDVELITSLGNLHTFIVKDNNFECRDMRLAQLKDYTRNKGISYKDPCQDKKKRKKSEQFERMMAIEPQTPEKNVWIYDEEEEGLKNVRVVEVCRDAKKNSSIGILSLEKGVDGILLELISMSPVVSVVIILVFGIFLGLIIGCSVELNPRKINPEQEDLHLPDGIVGSRARSMSIGSRLAGHSPEAAVLLRQSSVRSAPFMRQSSVGSSYRPRTRSGGSRKALREDRNVLLLHEAGISDSTPVITRKTYL